MAVKKNNDTKTSNKKKLSIQISLSGLSFCVLNTTVGKIETYEYISFNKTLNPFETLERLIHYFETKAYLQESFDDILVIHENDLSTIVPKPLFDENHLADYLKFNSKILKTDYLSYDNINTINAVTVYVPYVNINNYIYDAFGEFTYKHFSTILVDTILANHNATDIETMYLHVSHFHFEIIVIEKGQLILYNTFEYQNKEDFIYYVLFVAEQLNYNPENFNLVFAGTVTKNDPLYAITYDYVRNISILDSTLPYNFQNDIDALESNFIITNSF